MEIAETIPSTLTQTATTNHPTVQMVQQPKQISQKQKNHLVHAREMRQFRTKEREELLSKIYEQVQVLDEKLDALKFLGLGKRTRESNDENTDTNVMSDS